MQSLACLNGEIMPADEARVPIWDRGFIFGDAIYEVYRLYRGRLWIEQEHTARLRRSLAEMMFPPVDIETLMDRVRRTIEVSEVGEGTAYIHITRGVAPRAHAFPSPEVTPTELIVIKPYDDTATARAREQGVLVVSQPDLRWRRCDVKSTNLLGNVLAMEAAKRAGGFEAVLVDDGLVTEATHSSLLWVRNGQLEATPNDNAILPGTTRFVTGTLAEQLGIPFRETRVTLDELKGADEVLMAGTTIEVMPVVSIDGSPVNDAVVGPVTRRLQEAFRAAVARWLAEAPAPQPA